MHLVDDVHAPPDLARRVDRIVAQHAHRIHAVIRCRVDFQHVHTASVVDGPAGRAAVAGIAVLRVEAVDGLGKNFRAGGLARATRASKQIRVAELSRLDLRAQRVRHALLPHHVRKRLRPVFPIQSLIHASHPTFVIQSLLYTIPKKNGSTKVGLVNPAPSCVGGRCGHRLLRTSQQISEINKFPGHNQVVSGESSGTQSDCTPSIEYALHPLPIQPARKRLPHGTQGGLLSAAWFPT